MTPADIETAARNRYNATSDTFFTQSEIMYLIYAAELEMAREGLIIEAVDTSLTSVANQRSYSFPSNVIAIKRLEYNGQKLHPITFREDDALTLYNQTTTATGTPQYYSIWNKTLYLRPVPDTSAIQLTLYVNKEPTVPTATSTLEVPSMFHMGIVDFVVSEMYTKDKDFQSATYYRGLWSETVKDAKIWLKKMLRRDGFSGVQDEERLPTTILGTA